MTNYIEQIPDGVKVGAAVVAPMASLFGLTVEEWSYVLSCIVAILFIVEKIIKLYQNVKFKKCDIPEQVANRGDDSSAD